MSTQTVTQAYFRMLMEQMYKPVGGGVCLALKAAQVMEAGV